MLSVSAKYKIIPAIFLFACIGHVALYGQVRLGVGTGIQSYPLDLDPYDQNDRIPVLYPYGEVGFAVSDRISIAGAFSCCVIDGELDLYIDTPQELTIYTGSLSGEIDFSPGSEFFGIGAQVQSVVGRYRVSEPGEYRNGFGLKFYGIVRQRLFKDFSAGMRTGVQRVWVRAHASYINEELTLDSFNIDFVVYLDL